MEVHGTNETNNQVQIGSQSTKHSRINANNMRDSHKHYTSVSEMRRQTVAMVTVYVPKSTEIFMETLTLVRT